jgi:hypothetical protein
MSSCANGTLEVVGFIWAQLAPNDWRTAMVRRCQSCGDLEIVGVHWLDFDHPCICLSCLSQEVRWEGPNTWRCAQCGFVTRVLEE